MFGFILYVSANSFGHVEKVIEPLMNRIEWEKYSSENFI